MIFGPDLSSVLLWFSIRIGLRSESGFRSGVSFGSNLSIVHFWFWSELVDGLYLVLSTNLSLIWIFFCSGFVASPNLVFNPDLCLVRILCSLRICFSIRFCLRTKSGFRTEVVFSPIFSLVPSWLWSAVFFGPNQSLVRFCRRTKCDFRSGFVFDPTLVFDPNWSSFRIWFLVRSFLWSEFVFCTILFLAELVGGFYLVFGTKLSSICICLCSDFVARPNLVFTPDLCLVWICFSVRIRLWYEFVAVPNLAFGPCLPLVRLWFSIRFCLRSESGFRSGDSFGPNLSFVHLCFCSELLGGLHLVFGTNLSVLRFCC